MLYYFIILTYCALAWLCDGRTSPSGRSLPLRAEAEWGGMRPLLCHFLSDRFGGICSYFLLATILHLHPCLPSSALAACPRFSGVTFKTQRLGVGSGGHLETLGTQRTQPGSSES